MYGILMGPCVGMSHGVVVNLISGWVPEWAAIVMATATSFPTFLSIVQNQIITAFVNPDNLKVNAQVGPETFFSQPELLARVPGAVIIIGVMTFGCQLIGYILIFNPPRSPNQDKTKSHKSNTNLEMNVRRENDDVEAKTLSRGYDNEAFDHNGKVYGATDTSVGPSDLNNSEVEKCNNSHHENEANGDVKSNGHVREGTKNETEKNTPVSYTPTEVLKSPAYYAIIMFGIAMEFGILLKANFYKEFGQLYIHNDRFLTLVGTLIPVTSICSRIVLGTLVDKGHFTLKDVVVISLSINSILCFFWYIVPQVNAILYLLLVLGLALAQCLFWVVVPCAALRLFGPDHITINFGLVQVCVFLSSFIMPIVVPPIIKGLGWSWLFALCGIFSLVVLLQVVLTSFDTQKPKQN
ncbi:oxalate:formate antiporter [Elysia marginata]|uniref:Oxalate:formate antiporter n=1 Tax=Elysia marginata TaxID=1093978 RepID=A0AAV4EJ23_9GAST|nr:oxalate:formate antiporter [Elysia marginata]